MLAARCLSDRSAAQRPKRLSRPSRTWTNPRREPGRTGVKVPSEERIASPPPWRNRGPRSPPPAPVADERPRVTASAKLLELARAAGVVDDQHGDVVAAAAERLLRRH